jgi:hypothetical protein
VNGMMMNCVGGVKERFVREVVNMLINEKVVTFSTLSPLFHASEILAKFLNWLMARM